MRSIGLYEEASIEECVEKTGKRPISTKWVDVNKGTKERPDIRCRLVARDFRTKGEGARDDLFAATPPLEAKRFLIRTAAATWKSRRPHKIMHIDVKKAHLNGLVEEGKHVYVQLPGNETGEGDASS